MLPFFSLEEDDSISLNIISDTFFEEYDEIYRRWVVHYGQTVIYSTNFAHDEIFSQGVDFPCRWRLQAAPENVSN